ncbi:MAG: sulfatase-like hydrolase/transferase [bacterium]|nr:sulfatase-like hydrolase/transferase [bacterium]
MIDKKIFFAVTLLLLLFSPGESSVRKDSNILIITLDTTRADRIGSYGCKSAQTPNIDSIARNGILFENAYTPVPLTLPAHCSIFTGTLPLYHNVRNNGKYKLPQQIDTLAEILERNGFQTAAFISSFIVDSRFGLNQGFQTYNDNLPVKKGHVKTYASERPAASVYKDFAQWLETPAIRSRKKFFAWVHFFDPHMPYSPPEPFKSRFKENPYDGEIAYMDLYVGKIIELLAKKKILQNTFIVFAGDHGEAFGEHNEFGHMMFCYQENIKIPLILYAPNQLPKDKRISFRVNLTDIMPTVLDYLDITIPSHLDGISLLPPAKGKKGKERIFYIETVFPWESLGCAPVKGIIKEDYKFIDLPQPELYHLSRDPKEKENLFFKENLLAGRLKSRLARFIKKYDPLKFRSRRKLSPREERKLKTLGYFTTSRKRSPSGKLPDPKEKIASLTQFIEGNRLRGQARIEEAVRHFKRAIQISPTFSWPYSTLALVYFENGKTGEALHILEKGMRHNPGEYQLKIDYAMLLKKQSRLDEALTILEELRREGDAAVDVAAEASYLLGDLYARKGDKQNAIACYREALETEPHNRVLKQKLVYLLHQSQKLSEALVIYRQLEKETPGDHGLRFNIALLLAQTGDLKEAVKQMKRFIADYPHNDDLKKTALRYLDEWLLFP